MSRKVLARLLGVLRNRLAQRRQVVEFRLVTQLAQKAYAEPAPVELAVPVEQMHFEQRHRDRIHRRAASDARHAAAEVLHLHDIDAAKRRPLRERDIRGRKTELAPKARALPDLAAEHVGAPSSRSARAKSPAASAARTAELDTRSPSKETSGIASRAKPSRRAAS